MRRVGKILAGIIIVLMLAFVIFRTPDTDPAEMRAKYGGAPSQFVELEDGLSVHLRDEGPREAPTIILLHGSNADLHTWDAWADALKADFRVIRYDQIGHGLTGPSSTDDYSLSAFVEDVEEVADRLGVESFVLAGNSMGGWIAMGYALEHSERLDGLVLVDASGSPVRREGGGNLAFKLAAMPVVGDVMSQLLPRSLVERSYQQSVSNQAIITDAEVDRYWELARYPGNRRATRIRFSTPRNVYSADQLAQMRVPTLVMWGEEDTLVPFEAAAWYSNHLPNAQIVSYPGIGHVPQQENPQHSAADLEAWLSKLELE